VKAQQRKRARGYEENSETRARTREVARVRGTARMSTHTRIVSAHKTSTRRAQDERVGVEFMHWGRGVGSEEDARKDVRGYSIGKERRADEV
jgi:hypothetical protein